MDNLILPTICILLFMAFLLFSMRMQLTAMFRGESPFADPQVRELLEREKQRSKDVASSANKEQPPTEAP